MVEPLLFPPAALEQVSNCPSLHVLRALEHEVLEQMREAGSSGLLVGGADVVPDVDGHDRHRLVLMQDHVEAVGELELPERHLKRRGGAGDCPRTGADTAGQGEQARRRLMRTPYEERLQSLHGSYSALRGTRLALFSRKESAHGNV